MVKDLIGLPDPFMNNQGPKLSVIILSYNHGKYIRACLESVRAIDYPNTDVHLLDDGSSDRTADIARSCVDLFGGRLEVVTQPQSGGAIAKNSQKLLDLAKGDYVLFLSGDDFLLPGFPASKSIQSFEEDENLQIILSRVVHVDFTDSSHVEVVYTPQLRQILLSGDPFVIFDQHLCRSVSRLFLQGTIMRRSFLDEIGGFDTTGIADDYALFMRAFTHLIRGRGRVEFREENAWIYRVHGQNIHADYFRQRELVFQVVRKYVPKTRWSTFSWDHPEPIEFEGLVELAEQYEAHFGEDADSLIIPDVIRRYVHRARDRNDYFAIQNLLDWRGSGRRGLILRIFAEYMPRDTWPTFTWWLHDLSNFREFTACLEMYIEAFGADANDFILPNMVGNYFEGLPKNIKLSEVQRLLDWGRGARRQVVLKAVSSSVDKSQWPLLKWDGFDLRSFSDIEEFTSSCVRDFGEDANVIIVPKVLSAFVRRSVESNDWASIQQLIDWGDGRRRILVWRILAEHVPQDVWPALRWLSACPEDLPGFEVLRAECVECFGAFAETLIIPGLTSRFVDCVRHRSGQRGLLRLLGFGPTRHVIISKAWRRLLRVIPKL